MLHIEGLNQVIVHNGRELVLQENFTIGSSPEAFLRLEASKFVEPIHAHIKKHAFGTSIVATNIHKPIFINGCPIQQEEYMLKNGDTITIGGQHMSFSDIRAAASGTVQSIKYKIFIFCAIFCVLYFGNDGHYIQEFEKHTNKLAHFSQMPIHHNSFDKNVQEALFHRKMAQNAYSQLFTYWRVDTSVIKKDFFALQDSLLKKSLQKYLVPLHQTPPNMGRSMEDIEKDFKRFSLSFSPETKERLASFLKQREIVYKLWEEYKNKVDITRIGMDELLVFEQQFKEEYRRLENESIAHLLPELMNEDKMNDYKLF